LANIAAAILLVMLGTAPIATAQETLTASCPGDQNELLIDHRLSSSRDHGLVFGRTAERPFSPTPVTDRADAAWRRVWTGSRCTSAGTPTPA
jgi:hypothetical protein